MTLDTLHTTLRNLHRFRETPKILKYYLSRTYELRTIYDAIVKQTPASEYIVRDKWALLTKSVTYIKT